MEFEKYDIIAFAYEFYDDTVPLFYRVELDSALSRRGIKYGHHFYIRIYKHLGDIHSQADHAMTLLDTAEWKMTEEFKHYLVSKALSDL